MRHLIRNPGPPWNPPNPGPGWNMGPSGPYILGVLTGEVAGFIAAMIVFCLFKRRYHINVDYWSMAVIVIVMEVTSFIIGVITWTLLGV